MDNSHVSICNRALSRVGGSLITSLDDDGTPASLCNILYAGVRETVMQEFPWSFAIKRYSLAPVAQKDPANPYGNKFLLPAKVSNVIWASDSSDDTIQNNLDWRLEGEHILANAKHIYIKAVVSIDDPTKYDAMFVQAVVVRLAAELAIPIAASTELQQTLMREYGQSVTAAATKDGQQGRIEQIRTKRYLNARHRG